ncbi:unnamed protein product [Closterium sp. NIES-65]|nr:unnamed protein product [Closterium sp. NIES-65]
MQSLAVSCSSSAMLAGANSLQSASSSSSSSLIQRAPAGARSISFARPGRLGSGLGRRRVMLVTAATGGAKGFGKADDGKSRWAPDVSAAQEVSQRPSRAASDDDRLFEERLREVRRAPSRAASDDDRLFEERLREVRRQAEEKKRAKAVQSTAAIDYDNPQTEPLVDTAALTKDLPTKEQQGQVSSTAAIDYDNPQTEPLVDTAALTKDLPTKVSRAVLLLGTKQWSKLLGVILGIVPDDGERIAVQTEPLVDMAALTKDLLLA